MKTPLQFTAGLLAFTLLSAAPPPDDAAESHVFLSVDHGHTWRPADAGLPANDGIHTMLVHNKLVIAGTDKHGVWVLDKRVWYPRSKGLPKESRVISLLSHKELLFAGVYRVGLFYSIDDGYTWKPVSGGPPRVNIRALTEYAGDIYAGSDQGLFRIKSNGSQWDLVLDGVQINGFSRGTGCLYAATQKGLSRSLDGNTWHSVYNGTAIDRVANFDNQIVMLDYSGHVYQAFADKPGFILNDTFLPSPTFRLTPVSTKIFSGDWPEMGTWVPVKRQGLPANMPFNTLLETPDGILAAGPKGC